MPDFRLVFRVVVSIDIYNSDPHTTDMGRVGAKLTFVHYPSNPLRPSLVSKLYHQRDICPFYEMYRVSFLSPILWRSFISR